MSEKKTIKVSDLKPGYHAFGNNGNVWNDTVHIWKNNSHTGRTMCGTPGLSSNHAKISGHPTVGCQECIALYEKETAPMKFAVTARAFDRVTGEPKCDQRTEVIDTATNVMFEGMRTAAEIHDKYEQFWNGLNTQSEDVVFVSEVTIIKK